MNSTESVVLSERLRRAKVVFALDNLSAEGSVAIVRGILEGNQVVMGWILDYIQGAGEAEISLDSLKRALAKATGKHNLWQVWVAITSSDLSEEDKKQLHNFFDGPEFRPQLEIPRDPAALILAPRRPVSA